MATMALKVYKAFKRKRSSKDANMMNVDDDGSIIDLNTDDDPMDMGLSGNDEFAKNLSDEDIDDLIQQGILDEDDE